MESILVRYRVSFRFWSRGGKMRYNWRVGGQSHIHVLSTWQTRGSGSMTLKKNLIFYIWFDKFWRHLELFSNKKHSLHLPGINYACILGSWAIIQTYNIKLIRWKSLSYLMKITIKSPQKLTDDDLETIIGIWTRKLRRIVV